MKYREVIVKVEIDGVLGEVKVRKLNAGERDDCASAATSPAEMDPLTRKPKLPELNYYRFNEEMLTRAIVDAPFVRHACPRCRAVLPAGAPCANAECHGVAAVRQKLTREDVRELEPEVMDALLEAVDSLGRKSTGGMAGEELRKN